MDRHILPAALMLALCGCASTPDAYAPPEQRQPVPDSGVPSPAAMINMAEVGAESHFVQDISPILEAGAWRWTEQRPTVRVQPKSRDGQKFYIDFSTPDVTFKKLGPPTLSFYVNGHLLGAMRCDEAGHHEFQKAVPPEWIPAGADTTLAAEIDKVYVASDEGGRRYGFILGRMGLIQ